MNFKPDQFYRTREQRDDEENLKKEISKGLKCEIEIKTLIEYLCNPETTWVWSTDRKGFKDIAVGIFLNIFMRLTFCEFEWEREDNYDDFIQKYEWIFKKIDLQIDSVNRAKVLREIVSKWSILTNIFMSESRNYENTFRVNEINLLLIFLKDDEKLGLYGRSRTFFAFFDFILNMFAFVFDSIMKKSEDHMDGKLNDK